MNFFNNTYSGHGGTGCGFDCCSLLLWIILLNCLCGCGNNTGCGIDTCTLIILLLLCGCGGGTCK